MKDFLEHISQVSEQKVNRRAFLSGAAAVAGGIALAACSGGAPATNPSQGNAGAGSSGKKYTIAMVGGIAGVPFYEMTRKGAQEEAKAQNVELIYQAPKQWDPKEQSTIVDTLVARKVDAILIAPCDSQVLIAPLQKADSAGIKVITFDNYLGDGDYEKGPVKFPISYIGSNNTEGGKLAGTVLIKAIGGQGKVYIQNTQRGSSSSDQREDGFKQAINATNGAVTVAGVNYDGGDINKATAQTSAFLQSHTDIVGIFGTNAYSAEGAAAAVKNANKSGTIKVIHFDASEEGVADLRNGIIDFIIGQKPRDMGKISVQYAVKLLNGNTSDLKKRVQTDFIVIDKTNVDTPEAQNAIYKA